MGEAVERVADVLSEIRVKQHTRNLKGGRKVLVRDYLRKSRRNILKMERELEAARDLPPGRERTQRIERIQREIREAKTTEKQVVKALGGGES